MLLPESQVFVASPDNADAIGFQEHDAHKDHEHNNHQLLLRQLQQLLAPWQTMRLGNDAMHGLKIAKVTSGRQTVKG